MAIQIRTHLSQVSARGLGGASPVQASPDSFGAQSARALGELGQQVESTGFALDRMLLERRAAEMKDSLNSLEDEAREFSANYEAEKQGHDALSAAADHEAFLDQKITERRSSIKDPRVLQDFDRKAGTLRGNALARASAYQRDQEAKWKTDLLEADRIKIFAAASDPTIPENQKRAAFDDYQKSVAALYPGPKEARLAKDTILFQKGLKNSWETHLKALAQTDPESGINLLDATLYGHGRPPLAPEITSLAVEEANRQGVNPALVLSVLSRESGGNAAAVSPAGARGLMQLMPGTAKELGVDPDDPAQNVKGGVSYLKQMLAKYEGEEALALAAYNWGPGNVDAWIKTGKGKNGQDLPEETKNYIPAVMGMTKQYGSEKEIHGLQKSFNTPELLMQRSTMEKALVGKMKADEYALKGEREKAEKSIYAKAYDKTLTRADVEAARDMLTPEDYFKSLKLLDGGTSLPDKSDPEALIMLQRMAVSGDASIQETADDFLRSGRITNGDYSKMLNEGQQWRKPVIRQADEVLRLKTGYSEMNPNPDAGNSYLMARDDFQTWLDSEEGQKAGDEEKLRMANRVGDNYRLSQSENILSVPVPLFLVGSRATPDIKATVTATNKALAEGRISETEYAEQARRIKRMADILERQAQEARNTKESRR